MYICNMHVLIENKIEWDDHHYPQSGMKRIDRIESLSLLTQVHQFRSHVQLVFGRDGILPSSHRPLSPEGIQAAVQMAAEDFERVNDQSSGQAGELRFEAWTKM